MDEIHQLHYYGKYSFSDIMDMTTAERNALIDRMHVSQTIEAKAFEKAVSGK